MSAKSIASLFFFLAFSTFATAQERDKEGLVILYDFSETSGGVVHDRSNVGKPVDLEIRKMEAVEWKDGALVVKSPVLIRSDRPASKLIEAARKSNAITMEAWIRPRENSTEENARIVTLSEKTNERNITLSQDGKDYLGRLRTTSTDGNGEPSVRIKGGASTALCHLVYTREANGTVRLYINGSERAKGKVDGKFSNWSNDDQLAIANELTSDRPWTGEFHLVAIYSRALSVNDVKRNYAAGPNPKSIPPFAEAKTPEPPKKPEPAKPAPVVKKPEPPKPATPAVVKKPEPPKPASKPVVILAKEEAAPVVVAKPAALAANVTLPVINLPDGQKLQRVDFERHVLGVMSRQGCNTGTCHGSLQGESDMQLSLFGYNPTMDFKALTDIADGARIDKANPENSFMLRKPTKLMAHKGGQKFEKDSWQYQVLRNWILAGADRTENYGAVTKMEVTPALHRLSGPGGTVQVKVTATFADGSKEDVTSFCQFHTQDDFIATVTENGKVKGVNPGDTAVVVSYRDQVIASRVMVAVPMNWFAATWKRWNSTAPAAVNYIDHEVFAKLAALNIEPSALSSDGEFLRRVYIDTIGRLPSPDEARAFLADSDSAKRNKVIDKLLADPLHAALWATKFSDFTGNDTASFENPGEKRSKMWHDWFRDRIAANMPYDQLVSGILLATSREGNSAQEWIQEARVIDEQSLKSFETPYAERETLDLFWARRNVPLEAIAEQTAAAFLGVQLECAQCHKHPYDRWTQTDYRAFANLFGQVKAGTPKEDRKMFDEENNRRKKIKDKDERLPALREVYLDLADPANLRNPENNEKLTPALLGAAPVKMEGDYREAVVQWIKQKDNPFFARAFVNRVWAHYMGVGIVEPVDGFSAANPPSNEKLLAALAQDFVNNKYDIRKLEKEILRSRTYQLTSLPSSNNAGDKNNYARKYPNRMMAEVVVDVLNSALGTTDKFNQDAPEGSQAIEVAASRVRDGNLSYVFNVFGRPPRKAVCDCERSLDPALPQILYLMTDNEILEKIRDGRIKTLLAKEGRLDKLRKKELPDAEIEKIVDELFLASLTRLPDASEKTAALDTIRKQPGTETGFHDIAWALINTREFILNH